MEIAKKLSVINIRHSIFGLLELLVKKLTIVSGGQTGADRAALDWAIEHGIPHGD